MADVFVSYKHTDRAAAARLADYLDKFGFSVFWDPNIRNGEQWNNRLESELTEAKCIVVLWSKNSIDSEWVIKEVQRGSNRQVLAPARIDDCIPRPEYNEMQLADLRNWTDNTTPPGLNDLVAHIRELIDEENGRITITPQSRKLILAQKEQNTNHISISDHARDMAAILAQLDGASAKARQFIQDGYRELQSAQRAAREILDARAPDSHYASAADHFKNALDAIGDMKLRTARDGRSVEYFLSMERANSLAFSEPFRGEKYQQALDIYRNLASFDKYKNDIPVRFRLGCALARGAHTRGDIYQAIEALQDAVDLINPNQVRNNGEDGRAILTEGQWLYSEISLQMGVCQYRLFRLLGVMTIHGRGALDKAIWHTNNAVAQYKLLEQADPSTPKPVVHLMTLTIYKAIGNLIYYHSLKVRIGREDDRTRPYIRELIDILMKPDARAIVENQIDIVSSIAVGAATIGDWTTAEIEAQRNHDALTQMATAAPLSADDRGHVARAREIMFFAPKIRDMEKRLAGLESKISQS